MTDETTPKAEASAPARSDDRNRSSYRSNAPAAAAVDSRLNGGAGVQRSHLRNRKAWLKGRTRAGQTWSQRKFASTTYCPAKVRAG
jgi:hypothetical protein